MNFNFKDKFKDYSNFELLKIIKQPNKFQAEAVDAAAHLLESRTVSAEDMQELNGYFENIETKEQEKAAKINAYKDKANDFLEPIIKPSKDLKVNKWLNLFLVLLLLQYAWSLYQSITTIVAYIACTSCEPDLSILFVYASIFYIPLIIYLLYKRRTWGWILIFAETLISLIFGCSNIYFYFKYPYFTTDTLGFLLFNLFIRAGFVFFLWQFPVTALFRVRRKTKKDTLLVTIVLAILYLGVMMALYA